MHAKAKKTVDFWYDWWNLVVQILPFRLYYPLIHQSTIFVNIQNPQNRRKDGHQCATAFCWDFNRQSKKNKKFLQRSQSQELTANNEGTDGKQCRGLHLWWHRSNSFCWEVWSNRCRACLHQNWLERVASLGRLKLIAIKYWDGGGQCSSTNWGPKSSCYWSLTRRGILGQCKSRLLSHFHIKTKDQ